MRTMRAKFIVDSVELFPGLELLKFSAVTNGKAADNTYSQYTPAASCQLQVTNPALLGKFKPGQKFYVDFVQAE